MILLITMVKFFRSKARLSVFVLFSLLWTSCGDPVQLTTDSSVFEEDLNSETAKEKKIREPKYKTRTALVRRPISDVVETNTDVPPPTVPPVPKGETSPPTADSPPSPYVASLEEETTVPAEAKLRRPAPKETKAGVTLTITFTGRAKKPKVDIIFIVDASPSMRPFLNSQRIRQQFDGVVSALAPLDWQMMFTNADYGDRFFLFNLGAGNGKAMSLEHDGRHLLGTTVLNKQTPHYEEVFLDTLRRSEFMEHLETRGDEEYEKPECALAPGCHSMTFNEQPLKALKHSFVNNRSFFRPGADVVAIIFSDSDEGERHRIEEKRTKAKQVLKAFERQWGMDNKRLIAYGIIMIPGEDQACLDKHSKDGRRGERVFGTELARMAELTNGANYSLCDENYVPLARRMVADIQEK